MGTLCTKRDISAVEGQSVYQVSRDLVTATGCSGLTVNEVIKYNFIIVCYKPAPGDERDGLLNW